MNFTINHCGTTGPLVTTLLVLASAAPAQAVLLLKVEQIGSDVVVTGGGSVNLFNLTFGSNDNNLTNTFAAPSSMQALRPSEMALLNPF